MIETARFVPKLDRSQANRTTTLDAPKEFQRKSIYLSTHMSVSLYDVRLNYRWTWPANYTRSCAITRIDRKVPR